MGKWESTPDGGLYEKLRGEHFEYKEMGLEEQQWGENDEFLGIHSKIISPPTHASGGSSSSYNGEGGIEVIVAESSEVNVAGENYELSFEEAETLTDNIKNAATMLWYLIMKAHAGKAWKVLGYHSWSEYVKEEFNISRSRSYQIIDQGKVIKAIESVAPEGTKIELTEAEARDLKYVLDTVLPEVGKKTENATPEESKEIIRGIIDEQRKVAKLSEGPDGDEEVFENQNGVWEFITDAPASTGTGKQAEKLEPQHVDDMDDWGVEISGGDDGGGNSNSSLPSFKQEYVDARSAGMNMDMLKEYADAVHHIRVGLASFASLPEDIEGSIQIMSDEQVEFVQANLRQAEYNFRTFMDLWQSLRNNPSGR